MKPLLEHVLQAISDEAEHNPTFAFKIAEALRLDARAHANEGSVRGQQRNKRMKAALDPYAVITEGIEVLKARLSSLEVDQLKDIVSEHSLDASRLVLKWRTKERLIAFIVNTVRMRVEKGDVFRV